MSDSSNEVEENITTFYDLETSIDVPVWGVVEFFEKFNAATGHLNISKVTAKLNIEFSMLSEDDLAKINAVQDAWWFNADLYTTRKHEIVTEQPSEEPNEEPPRKPDEEPPEEPGTEQAE